MTFYYTQTGIQNNRKQTFAGRERRFQRYSDWPSTNSVASFTYVGHASADSRVVEDQSILLNIHFRTHGLRAHRQLSCDTPFTMYFSLINLARDAIISSCFHHYG